MTEEDICPLLSMMKGGKELQKCMGRDCAWYGIDDCAIREIPQTISLGELEKRPVFVMRRKTFAVFVREALYLFLMT